MYREAPALVVHPEARRLSRALLVVGLAHGLGAMARLLLAPIATSLAAWPFATHHAARLDAGQSYLASLGARDGERWIIACRAASTLAALVQIAALVSVARAQSARSARAAARVAMVVLALQECSAWVGLPRRIDHYGRPPSLAESLFGLAPLAPALALAVPLALLAAAAHLARWAPRALRLGALALGALCAFVAALPPWLSEAMPLRRGDAPPVVPSSWALVAAVALPSLVLAALLAARASIARAPALPPEPRQPASVLASRRATGRFALAIALHAAATCTAVGGVARLVFARSVPLPDGARYQLMFVPVIQAVSAGVMLAAAHTLGTHAAPAVAAAARRSKSFALMGFVAALLLAVFLGITLGGDGPEGSLPDIATGLFAVFEAMPLAATWALARAMRSEHGGVSPRRRVALGMLGEALSTSTVLVFAYISIHERSAAPPGAAVIGLAALAAMAAGIGGAIAVSSVLDDWAAPVAGSDAGERGDATAVAVA